MPLPIHTGAPTLFIRKAAYEQSGLVRAAIDTRLGLTPEEFRVEGEVVTIGPIYDTDAFAALVDDLEKLGLTYYDDFFELTGNWPDWLAVFAGAVGVQGRNKPSQPHS
jgi:hypothetical protein